MAKSPFKLKSGNTTPFKQMGSAPMTRSQARSLSQKHMKGGAYTTMPGESRFQMHQRLRRAGTMGDTVVEGKIVKGTETYLGKHLEANKMKREGEGYEGKTQRRERREKFTSDIRELGEGLMSIPGEVIKKASKGVEKAKERINISGGGGGGSSSGGGTTDYSTYESVNALSKERDRMRDANEDETEIQNEINKRLEENPGKWD